MPSQTESSTAPGRSGIDGPQLWHLPSDVKATLARVADTRFPILCLECSGPAFARVATAIHRASGRQRLFLCDVRPAGGGLPAGLPRGEIAAKCTLALDGIEMLDEDGQTLLAEYLEQPRPRLISATTAQLDDLSARWRPDLFAVVSTVTVRTPSLARRVHELPALIARRLPDLCVEIRRPVPRLSASAHQALAAHDWPGDVAELEAVLVRTLVALEHDTIDAADLKWDPVPKAEPASTEERAAAEMPCMERPSAPRPAATVEALAVELAHQLKNPLVTVKTFVDNAAQLASDPDELGHFSNLATDAVTRMDELLDGLVEFARLGPPQEEAVEVLTPLRDALRDLWPAYSAKQVSLRASDDASLPAVADRDHLRFAFTTLARHVLETIEPRSTLAVEVDPGGTLRFIYRESGSATHLRGVTGDEVSSFPLALLLVRGALERMKHGLEASHRDAEVTICLWFQPT